MPEAASPADAGSERGVSASLIFDEVKTGSAWRRRGSEFLVVEAKSRVLAKGRETAIRRRVSAAAEIMELRQDVSHGGRRGQPGAAERRREAPDHAHTNELETTRDGPDHRMAQGDPRACRPPLPLHRPSRCSVDVRDEVPTRVQDWRPAIRCTRDRPRHACAWRHGRADSREPWFICGHMPTRKSSTRDDRLLRFRSTPRSRPCAGGAAPTRMAHGLAAAGERVAPMVPR